MTLMYSFEVCFFSKYDLIFNKIDYFRLEVENLILKSNFGKKESNF